MSSYFQDILSSTAFLLTLLPNVLAATGAQCYFPDGSEAANYTSCNAAATQSSCCRTTEACLSNGYCFQQTSFANRISRGACTDSSFGSTACPARCRDVARSVALTIFQAYDTADDAQGNGMFCCVNGYNDTTSQCGTRSDGTYDPFSLPAGSVIIDRSNGATIPEDFNSTEAAASVITVTATAESTAAGSATNVPANSNTAVVAAGVAVPLGVLLIAALAGCAVLWRNLKKARKQLAAAGHDVGGTAVYHDPQKGEYYSAQGKPYDHSHGGYQSVPHHASPPAEVGGGPMQAVEAPTDRDVAMADSRSISK